MNTFQKTIITTLLSIGGLFAASEGAPADPPFRKTREEAVVFSEVIPSEGDLIRIDHDFRVRNKDKATPAPANKPTRVYVARIFVELPQTSMAVDLHVGDIPIGEYYSCVDGVFFKIYGDDDLERYYGKPFRFVFNKTEYDLGISFPSENETLPFRQDSGQTKTLPTLKEFLDGQANFD